MSPEEIEKLKSEITAEAKAEATQALGEVIHKTQVSSHCAVQRLIIRIGMSPSEVEKDTPSLASRLRLSQRL